MDWCDNYLYAWALKLKEMRNLAEENKDIIAFSRANDVEAREKARANYNKANDIGSEIQNEGNEEHFNSIDAQYDERASKILASMDSDLKDRRWSILEMGGHDRATPCPTSPILEDTEP